MTLYGAGTGWLAANGAIIGVRSNIDCHDLNQGCASHGLAASKPVLAIGGLNEGILGKPGIVPGGDIAACTIAAIGIIATQS